MSYYYLLSTLPRLSLLEEFPFDELTLFSEVSDTILPDDRREVSLINSGRMEFSNNTFIRERFEEERQLRNALAELRAARRGLPLPPRVDEGEFSSYTEKTAAWAMSQKNPLERELILDKYRWQLLEEAVLDHPFEAEELFSLFLKLKLVSRWSRMRAGRGKTILEDILEENMKRAGISRGGQIGNG